LESKYASEEIWREALAVQRAHLRTMEQPEWAAYGGPREAFKAKHRIERIWVAGLPEWQERDNA